MGFAPPLQPQQRQHHRLNMAATTTTSTTPTQTTTPTNKRISTVYKFGGSSLANAERIDHVAHLIKDQVQNHHYQPKAVVCSAMGKTTNMLLQAGQDALNGESAVVNIDSIRQLHEETLQQFGLEGTHTSIEISDLLEECTTLLRGIQLLQELSPQTYDHLVSIGERCSVRLVSARLNQIGIPSIAMDAWEVGIITNDQFQKATLVDNYQQTISQQFQMKIGDPENTVPVITGFLGATADGKITTLGRGGSDLSATAIGSALKVDEITVWKDVNGILTTDPNIYDKAQSKLGVERELKKCLKCRIWIVSFDGPITGPYLISSSCPFVLLYTIAVDYVTFEEASELAQFGATVLHPIAMQPCIKHNVPVRVRNSVSFIQEILQHQEK